MSSELKILLFTIMLIGIGITALMFSLRHCDTVEYQDLNGSHFIQVCEGE
jgi:hypothetical protein